MRGVFMCERIGAGRVTMVKIGILKLASSVVKANG